MVFASKVWQLQIIPRVIGHHRRTAIQWTWNGRQREHWNSTAIIKSFKEISLVQRYFADQRTSTEWMCKLRALNFSVGQHRTMNGKCFDKYIGTHRMRCNVFRVCGSWFVHRNNWIWSNIKLRIEFEWWTWCASQVWSQLVRPVIIFAVVSVAVSVINTLFLKIKLDRIDHCSVFNFSPQNAKATVKLCWSRSSSIWCADNHISFKFF